MGDILLGTASWTETTLIKSGRFYPPEVKTPEDRLRFYASQFPVVEVDKKYRVGFDADPGTPLADRRSPYSDVAYFCRALSMAF